jgi:hypothetical protein
MDDATQLLLDGLAEFEAVGSTFTWNSLVLPVCAGPEVGGKLLEAGGLRINAANMIVIRVSHFNGGSLPAEKEKGVFLSVPEATPKTYRIDARTIFRNALLILECNDPAQGA